ncbi:MAG: MATE family efflux transporter [Prevotella sp.]|nr:MATE family efflux transporter [Prevotella sp.]
MSNNKATLELGTKPIGSLLLQYALPAIIAMTASSLYNMVDSVFIGQGVGPMAIAGLAITFPFMNLSAAFGAAIGVGSSALLSVKLGQRDYSIAQKILGNNITLNVIVGVLLAVICLVFLDPILMFFGASEQTLPYAREYMEVILLGNVITHLYFGMNAVLRAASKPRQAMYATMFTVALNTALDPLFIYTFDMGIRGAAVATILSQSLALIWQLRLFSNKQEFLHLRRGIYKLRSDIVKNILAIGMSPFAMNVCACIIVILINNGLMRHGGDLAVGAYGIVNRVAFVFVMICMGINQGMQPIAGYNYGAQQYDRLMQVLKLSIIAATTVMVVGFIVAMLVPQLCVRLFTSHEELIGISVKVMRIVMLAFPIVGYQMVITIFFQSIGKAKVSIFLSLSRQLLFLLPPLLILPQFMGIDGILWSMPLSDMCSAIVTFVIMSMFIKRMRKNNLKQSM